MTVEDSGETARITSQVATLDGKIRELNKERVALLQKLNHIRSPMISRIPPEVLSRIFWFATISSDEVHEPRLSDTKSLFELRSVCSHWRRATDSSPHLWTTLTLNQKLSYGQTRATDYAGLVKHYFQRLGAAAMLVYIYDLTPLTGATVDEIVGIILKESPGRLRTFKLLEDSGLVQNAVFEYAQRDVEFALLEELELHWSRGGKQRQNTLFRNSPRLRTLSITGDGSEQIPLNLPWRQLTTLDLHKTSPKYASLLLTLCPNLVKYDFSYFDGDINPWIATPSQITSMQFLQDLSWIFYQQGHFYTMDPQFFERFRFPAVRKLQWVIPLPSDAPSVRNFFANMQALEELTFCPSEWQYCIDQHLGVFHNLTTLKAHIDDDEGEGVPEWLQRLTVKPGNDNWFPRLQTLHLTVGDVAPHGLIVVLYSRRNGPVDWSDPIEQDPEDVILPPYDLNSTHWLHHTRLLEFSTTTNDAILQIDWTWSPHYGAMKAMMLEAREVEGFEGPAEYENRILF